MSSTAHKTVDTFLNLLVYISILFLLLLSANNINNHLQIENVLGTESENLSQTDKYVAFWENFLSENPNYAPGWKEVERMDRVHEIDPNFITESDK